ncbi:hypothetical protein [Thorsellia anophelis]|uniref:Uncharacterized protein n=1 Tax=Thorsellia anophelis DSM 18579 TaxID=1123402 RepID=A0A1H9YE59_9GAMM|nr:hypothetical protein [Thorsellia anophelis]SES67241.1 hypothetical protein SAMN02583745_00211 [Thorsellia anophelis DSM 18579]
MPNEFWPSTTNPPSLPGGIGNSIQQNTAANNPDVFCKSQGSGYRLPSIGEFHANTKSLSPGSSHQAVQPGHWSQYVNNDTTKARLPNDATRNVNGSLYNEWGDVSKYVNGWEAGNYWSSEVAVVRNISYSRSRGVGRLKFDPTLGLIYPPTDRIDTFALTSDAGNLYNTACVRDLVPTPSTANPSKT